VILTQDLKKDHMYQRLELKSAEETFSTEIVSGTNCSRFESSIIVKKAKEAFRIGEFADGRVLQDGQIVFYAVSAKAPSGVPIERCPKLRVVLSHLNRKEDIETLKRHGAAAKRCRRREPRRYHHRGEQSQAAGRTNPISERTGHHTIIVAGTHCQGFPEAAVYAGCTAHEEAETQVVELLDDLTASGVGYRAVAASGQKHRPAGY